MRPISGGVMRVDPDEPFSPPFFALFPVFQPLKAIENEGLYWNYESTSPHLARERFAGVLEELCNYSKQVRDCFLANEDVVLWDSGFVSHRSHAS